MNTKNIFIQDLKDTTTVLQQLRVCIDTIKSFYDNPQFDAKSYVDEKILEVNESINQISQEIDGINDDIDGIKGRVTTLEDNHTYCISLLFALGEDLNDSNVSYTCSVNTYVTTNSPISEIEANATELSLDKITQNEFVINDVRVYLQGTFAPTYNLEDYNVDNTTSNPNISLDFKVYGIQQDTEYHGTLDLANVVNTKICKIA